MPARIIDTCCLLNLFASGRADEILRHAGGFFVSQQIAAESITIRRYDAESPPNLVPEEVDLTQHFAEGLLSACDFEGEAETDLFVRFAMDLGDGEASALAIAQSRGWTVATDDKKARRIAKENGIPTTTTTEVVYAWAQATGPDDRQVGQVLKAIRLFASFRPPCTHAHYDWWMRLLEAEDG